MSFTEYKNSVQAWHLEKARYSMAIQTWRAHHQSLAPYTTMTQESPVLYEHPQTGLPTDSWFLKLAAPLKADRDQAERSTWPDGQRSLQAISLIALTVGQSSSGIAASHGYCTRLLLSLWDVSLWRQTFRS